MLSATTTLTGYWSDGRAGVRADVSLRNDGDLPVDGARTVMVECRPRVPGCAQAAEIHMEDGFGPVAAQFDLRLPMGRTSLEFRYGDDESLRLSVAAPERIVGVDRDLWECYGDRRQSEDTCGGWRVPFVEKWLSDVPVKVWATGDQEYISVFKTVLSELEPVLGLKFVWVPEATAADLTAYLGIDSEDAPTFDFDPKATDVWGFASWANAHNGETVAGYMVVWRDESWWGWRPRIDWIRTVTIHEALHALVPINHSTRPLSIMGRSYLNTWSPRDEALMRLNAHPLLVPGMSMEQARSMVVFTDELLDSPRAEQPDAIDIMWRALMALTDASSIRFKMTGGYFDGACQHLNFGVRRGPIELALGRFDISDDPSLAYVKLHNIEFLWGYSTTTKEWLFWQRLPSGQWEPAAIEDLWDASGSWNTWISKLHRPLRSIIQDGRAEDISVSTTPEGHMRLEVLLDSSYPNMWDWTQNGGTLKFALTVDAETYAIVGYHYERREAPDPARCGKYREVATDGQIGTEIQVPKAIRDALGMSETGGDE